MICDKIFIYFILSEVFAELLHIHIYYHQNEPISKKTVKETFNLFRPLITATSQVDGDLLRDRLQHQLVALKQGHRGTPKEMTKMTGRRIRAEQRHQATLAELYNRKTPDAGGPPETSAEEEGPSGSGAAGH